MDIKLLNPTQLPITHKYALELILNIFAQIS